MAGKAIAMDVRMATALVGAVPNVAKFCREHKISRQTFYKWRRRFAVEGVPGMAERSRRPRSSPRATSVGVQDAVVRVRNQLQDAGVDHGADAVGWYLRDHPEELTGNPVPSRATIHRILVRRGLVVAEPQKRPKSADRRFTFARPNECWQSDWTGWLRADGSPTAICGTLDDHSRYVGGLRAAAGHGTSELVWDTFVAAVGECGVPAMSLTDNGLVFSGKRRGTEVAYEVNLRALGVIPICSTPYHPQTCGKIERFWQTLKRWLAAQPRVATVDELNVQLEQFRVYYNQQRPHRALHGQRPAEVFNATKPARPAQRPLPTPVFVHTGRVNSAGSVQVGHYLINVGLRWQNHPVHTIHDGDHIVIFSGAQLVRELTANPNRSYQPATTARYDLRGHREPQPE
jgi:transposase InsO family protein